MDREGIAIAGIKIMADNHADVKANAVGRGLHLAHLNVRSLLGRGRADLVKHQISNSGYDIFTLSETWLTEAIPDPILKIQGYNLARSDRNWGGPGGGVPKKGRGLLRYVKEGINFSDSKFAGFNVSDQNIEMQWLLVSLPNVRPIVVVNVYRPPQGDYKKCCELFLDAYNRAELADNCDIFAMGDFNINVEEKKSPATKELIFTINSLGLRQLINEPTRTSFREGRSTATRIDLIFSNSDFVLDMNLSDHLAVAVTRKKCKQHKTRTEFKGRSYRNYVQEDFQNRLLLHNWDRFFEERDPNVLWDFMYSIIIEEINEMCPVKSFKVYERREPWITNEALEEIKDKDRILNRARRTGKEEDWALASRERNRVGRELELLRRDFLKNRQEEH